MIGEGDAISGLLSFGPVGIGERAIPLASATMEGIAVIILGDVIFLAIKGEFSLSDTIGDSTDGETIFSNLFTMPINLIYTRAARIEEDLQTRIGIKLVLDDFLRSA